MGVSPKNRAALELGFAHISLMIGASSTAFGAHFLLFLFFCGKGFSPNSLL